MGKYDQHAAAWISVYGGYPRLAAAPYQCNFPGIQLYRVGTTDYQRNDTAGAGMCTDVYIRCKYHHVRTGSSAIDQYGKIVCRAYPRWTSNYYKRQLYPVWCSFRIDPGNCSRYRRYHAA